ncbi:5-dehydro-4-deoxy-D-glucuronate isomerase [Blastococcus xanthinilyticus]|uniref:5-dehydro-4-deoxy-D-glucuronate isomerase n=1 Tax=Blastococcus xanthinilyticus TaxID=1564164 RepID=A0A5S5CUW3_9ACTN|nr:5-dehydro-4-deoxy-D-glucuronate isomerase [Blastococcus xanthinilyticus]TYP87591.1 4-deoxy-L-threo-5-hexulose uronate isomerase [Blastococcus xanthinilyticus]
MTAENRPMLEIRHAAAPSSVETATTEELRARFVVSGLFVPGEVRGTYTHHDRMVVAGAVPVGTDVLPLGESPVLGEGPFLARRELGIINVGDDGEVLVDGQAHRLGRLDGMYVPRGRDVGFRGEGARFYLASATAHTDGETAVFRHHEVEPVAVGDQAGASRRGLYRYVWGPGGHPSCQLQIGVTVVADGSVWNTMPPHLHDRRTEVYCYTGLQEGARVLHVMGEPGRTRHVWLDDGEAVISPPWSVHAGAGTGSYAFIWAMAGENNDYTDLGPVPVGEL